MRIFIVTILATMPVYLAVVLATLFAPPWWVYIPFAWAAMLVYVLALCAAAGRADRLQMQWHKANMSQRNPLGS